MKKLMKKTIKKLVFSLLIAAFAALLGACTGAAPSANATNRRLKIVTTVFPAYDWVMNILGDNPAGAEVVLLADNGVDMHSFQPSADDILTISTCDIFVYIGGESDEWVEKVLNNANNDHMTVVNLMEELGDKAAVEECIEGMQDDEESHADGNPEPDGSAVETDGDEHNEEEPEYDEHIWLSLRNAGLLCDSIESAIQTADPANAAVYTENLNIYKEKLNELDNLYGETVSTAEYDTLLFADRFPFRYLTDDYNLKYYAAFKGCSAESEAGFETIRFLADKVDELSLPAVCIIDGSDGKIAQTVISSTSSKDLPVITFDSMQSITKERIKNGESYLSIMNNNLTALKNALNN